jgi:hypothetical protein
VSQSCYKKNSTREKKEPRKIKSHEKIDKYHMNCTEKCKWQMREKKNLERLKKYLSIIYIEEG